MTVLGKTEAIHAVFVQFGNALARRNRGSQCRLASVRAVFGDEDGPDVRCGPTADAVSTRTVTRREKSLCWAARHEFASCHPFVPPASGQIVFGFLEKKSQMVRRDFSRAVPRDVCDVGWSTDMRMIAVDVAIAHRGPRDDDRSVGAVGARPASIDGAQCRPAGTRCWIAIAHRRPRDVPTIGVSS